MFDRGGVDPADRQVQRHAAEDLDTGHDRANEIGQAGRRVVVVLEDDGSLLPRLREPGRLNGVERPRTVVGIAVHVDVNRAFEQSRAIDGLYLPADRGASEPQAAHVTSAMTRLIPHELTSDDLRLTDFIVEWTGGL